MKRSISCLLALLLPLAPLGAKEKMSDHEKNTDKLYRTGAGAQDGAFTATAVSILGWGLGLGLVFGIVAAALHQSNAGHNGHCD